MVIVTVLRAKNWSAGWVAASPAASSRSAIASVRSNDATRLRPIAALRSAIAHTLAAIAGRTEKFDQRIRGGIGLFEPRGMAGAPDQRQVRGAPPARHISVPMGAPHHAIHRAPDHRPPPGGAAQPPPPSAI